MCFRHCKDSMDGCKMIHYTLVPKSTTAWLSYSHYAQSMAGLAGLISFFFFLSKRQNQLETPVNIVVNIGGSTLSFCWEARRYLQYSGSGSYTRNCKTNRKREFPGARFASEMQNSATVPCLLNKYAILYILYTADI